MNNIVAAFEGATVIHNLISPVSSVTESAEMVLKAGCRFDWPPVLGEVTFDQATDQYINLKYTEVNWETRTVTPIDGAPRLVAKAKIASVCPSMVLCSAPSGVG